MLNLPFSKLQIKIHALDNPTSVFKKRNLLSLNCINKTIPKKKSTPLRTYANDLPHYMMPLKSTLNQSNHYNNYNNKNKTNIKVSASPPFKNRKLKIYKNNRNNSKLNLPNLSKEKSEHILYTKINVNHTRNNNSSIKKSIQDISMPNINNSFHNIKLNDKNNSNNDINNNLKKNSLKNNNIINIYSNYQNLTDINNDINLSEQNYNHQSINNNSSDSGSQKNINKQFQSLISDLQKKINEQNKILSDRAKEIENLKKQIIDNEKEKDKLEENENNKNEINNNYFNNEEYTSNINNINEYKTENELLNKEIERYKFLLNDYKKNNQEKNQQNEINKEMIQKLQDELKNLKDNIESLSNKYQNELNNNKILEEKYKYIKNNTRTPEELIETYKNKIIQQENSITQLEEQLYQIKSQKNIFKKSKRITLEIIGTNNNKDTLQIARTLTREFIVKIEVVDGKLSSNHNINNNINDDTNEKIIIDSPSKKILSSKNSISSVNIIQNDNFKLFFNDKEYNKLQLLLNALFIINGMNEEILKEKINQIKNKKYEINLNEICQNLNISNKDLIKQFINDFLEKEKKGENVLKDLFKYNKTDLDKNINYEFKKNIFEKCLIYDYKLKKTIPFNYFKHLYKEMCHNKMISFSEKDFFNFIYECKKQTNNNIYSLYDIFYENLIKDENGKNSKKGEKINNNTEDKKNIINNENNAINNENNDDEINIYENNNNKNNNEINIYENNNNIINNNKNNNNEIKNSEESEIKELANNNNNIINNNKNNNEIKNGEESEIKELANNNNIINNNTNNSHKLKYKDLITNFLDKIIKEAIEKQKDDDDNSFKARSYDQDIYNKFLLQIDNNNISKLNKSSSDGEENDFEI